MEKSDVYIEIKRTESAVTACVTYKSFFGEQPIVEWQYNNFNKELQHPAYEDHKELIPILWAAFRMETADWEYCKENNLKQDVKIKIKYTDLI